MNYLERAKDEMHHYFEGNIHVEPNYIQALALIAIAEQLEKMNASKQEIYDQGYDAGIENLEAEIEYATKGMDK